MLDGIRYIALKTSMVVGTYRDADGYFMQVIMQVMSL